MEGKINCSVATAHNQSNKIETTTDLQIVDLPEEIIEDILLRLSVKSLLKWKCVSKSWFLLISSPKFVKTHLELSSRCHRFLFRSLRSFHYVKQCSVSLFMSKSSFIVASDVDYRPNYEIKSVGSCDGIICFQMNGNGISLWNPSTKRSKVLPLDVEMWKGNCYVWGFGYSEFEDDYKVVGISDKIGDGVDVSITNIYSLRSDSWKRIEDYPYGIPFDDTSRLASGKLHFRASTDWESLFPTCRWNIVSFDLKTEAYGILKQPYYEEGMCDSVLCTLGGCLSVLYEYPGIRWHLWIMKEYGVTESWTLVSIPYFFIGSNMFVRLKPLLIMPNGEILFNCVDFIMAYNPNNNCRRYFDTSVFDDFEDAQIYVESLVPI